VTASSSRRSAASRGGGRDGGGQRGGGDDQRGGKQARGKQSGGGKQGGGKQGGGKQARGKQTGGTAGGKQGGAKRGGGKQGGAPRRREAADDPVAALSGPLQRVLQRIPETQRKVLELRMGLVDGHPHDLADTARELGLSMSEARDIEKRAFEHIREAVPLEQLQRFLHPGQG
jgi:hypothetical protein